MNAIAKRDADLVKATGNLKWVPNPGPQTDAYFSQADVMLYGGEPGGGKSFLLLGLSFNSHKRSLIMRRKFVDLQRLQDDAIRINGSRDGFTGAYPPRLRLPEGREITFKGAATVGDEQGGMGQGFDFIGIDEATHFAETQIRFLMGWSRTEDPKQRCRVVLATNPPLTSEGLWVVKMFAPWLDEGYPYPAAPGELRWVVEDEDGDRWVDGPEPVWVASKGKMVQPLSRTFIPASVTDNPEYMASGYQKTLDNMPSEHYEILMGGFKSSFKDAEHQLIPTAWIRAAQDRWTPHPPQVPMCAMGVDPSGGGSDPLAIATRYDGWFDRIHEVPAKSIPKEAAGSFAAATVLTRRRDSAVVTVDMGGGYGGACFQILKNNGIDVKPYRGAESSKERTQDKQLKFYNTRAWAAYQFKEALDPERGANLALPDDPQLVSDLTSLILDHQDSFNGIKLEPKEKLCDRLGRSTNRGDAVIMCWVNGPKAATHYSGWKENIKRNLGRLPRVVMGRNHARP